MPDPRPVALALDNETRATLQKVQSQYSTAQQLAQRVRIILFAAEGKNHRQISQAFGISIDMARLWRNRWSRYAAIPLSELSVSERLADAPRSGKPSALSAEQVCKIVALACEAPEKSGHLISQWTAPKGYPEIADEIMHQDIVAIISPRHAQRILKKDLKPYQIRYWLTAPAEQDADFDVKVKAICEVYHQALDRYARAERTVSTDELTGVQALERKHPGLPIAPGKIERREFEYIRHGTATFILTRDVVTGKVIAPQAGPSRTEADFLAHAQAVVATDLTALRWHFVVDNLNIHLSESLVRWVANESDLEIDLGEKGCSGILANQQTRAANCLDELPFSPLMNLKLRFWPLLNTIMLRWLNLLSGLIRLNPCKPSYWSICAALY